MLGKAGWDDERVALLKKLWSEGLSCSQIASRLGRVTRNAVMGKVARLGLNHRRGGAMKGSRRPANAFGGAMGTSAKRPRKTNGKPAAVKIEAAGARSLTVYNRVPFSPPAEPLRESFVELVIPLAERKGVADLEPHHCRWPIGDPQHADFHFCGKDKVEGLPYCPHHSRRAFVAPQPKRAAGEVTNVREKVEA